MFLTVLFLLIVFLFFIPIRSISVMPVAPVNLVVYLFLIYSAINMRRIIQKISGTIFLLLLIFLLFSFLDSFDSYLKIATIGKLFGQIRGCIFIVMIAVFAANKRNFIFAYKIILLLITSSVFFGLLIYVFGEPFQTIRLMILGTHDVYIQTQGSRIAGFSASIFVFSYQLTVAVVLSFGVFLAEKKLKWLLFFSFLIIGVILNGERSSALMSFLAVASMLLFHFRKQFKSFIIVLLVIVSVVGAAKHFLSPPRNKSAHYETLLYRLGNKRKGEFLGRSLQGLAGVLSVVKNPLIGATNKQYQQEVHRLFKKYAHARIPSRTEIPAPHNHYINVGMHAGIPGMLLCIFFLFTLLKIHKKAWNREIIQYELSPYYLSICYALLAVLGNALFHNHGIFFAEPASLAMVGLLGAASIMKDSFCENECQVSTIGKISGNNLQ